MKNKPKGCFSLLLKAGVLLLIISFLASMIPVRNGVPFINQYPEFPNGCEVVSMSSLISFHGYDVSPGFLHDRYMPKAAIGEGDPKYAYIGNPRGRGFYSFQYPLVDTANGYFREHGISLRAKTYPITPYLAIAWQVHKGRPVIGWTTVDGDWPERVSENQFWKVDRGKTIKPYRNLHVHVVTGMEGWNVLVTDPTHGPQKIPLWKYLSLYYSMGARAVMVEPMDAVPDWKGMGLEVRERIGDLIGSV